MSMIFGRLTWQSTNSKVDKLVTDQKAGRQFELKISGKIVAEIKKTGGGQSSYFSFISASLIILRAICRGRVSDGSNGMSSNPVTYIVCFNFWSGFLLSNHFSRVFSHLLSKSCTYFHVRLIDDTAKIKSCLLCHDQELNPCQFSWL